GPGPLRVRRQLDGVPGGLRARVDRYRETERARVQAELRHPAALRHREQDPLAGRAAREDPVHTPLGEEADQGSDTRVIQGAPALTERRDGGRDHTVELAEHPLRVRGGLRTGWSRSSPRA